MEEILHQLIGSLSHYLRGLYTTKRWFSRRISEPLIVGEVPFDLWVLSRMETRLGLRCFLEGGQLELAYNALQGADIVGYSHPTVFARVITTEV